MAAGLRTLYGTFGSADAPQAFKEEIMASGILIVEVEEGELEQSKVGVWQTDDDGMITVVHLGTFPSKTSQLGGSAGDPETLARIIFSEKFR
jgi:hypothetical protein